MEGVAVLHNRWDIQSTEGGQTLGTKQQKFFAHGLDLVVRRAVFGKGLSASDVATLVPDSPLNEESEDDENLENER